MVDKPTISSEPPANTPNRNEPSTFADRADAWVAWIRDNFYPFLDASLDFVEQSDAASEAAQQAVLDNTEYQGTWVSGTTYSEGDTVTSPSDGQVYRRLTNGAGTTDPSSDGTNWVGISIANSQASSHDFTAGRLFKVGAAGWGVQSAPLVSDWAATDNESALWSWISSTTNFDNGYEGTLADAGLMLLLYAGASNGHRLLFPHTGAGGLQWQRYTSGAWQDADRLVGYSNLVGTVSESSGAPTGAVIQRGSGATSQWYRLADGTQRCIRRFSPGDSVNNGTWTFPVAFAALDGISGSHLDDGATPRDWFVSFASASTTSVKWTIFDNSSGGQPTSGIDEVILIAEGRWFT